MDDLKRCRELEILRAKESVREEIHAVHAEELRALDELIHLLDKQAPLVALASHLIDH